MTTTAIKPEPQTLPDGPQMSSLWQVLQWIGRPMDFMEECAQRYGDMFTIDLGRIGRLVFCSHPEAIQAIFTADAHTFDAGRSNEVLRPLLGDTSLVLLDGDRHQRQRQLLMPPFHGERMRAYGELVRQISEDVAATWQVGQPFSVRPCMQTISLRVILEAVFGVTDPDRYRELQHLLPALLDLTGSPLSSSLLFLRGLQRDWGAWSPWGRFVRQRSHLNQLIYDEIAQRRAEPDPSRTDILALLLAARDEAGEPMTDGELRDELMTMLFAGHETTASVLSWALYWIHALPEVYEQLMAELATCTDLSETKALMRLPYLGAVCQETLRMYPVAPIAFPRIAKVPVRVMGHQFEPETMLAPCIYLTHHRSDLYPNPESFQPQRFLERQFSPYEYLPFGGGNRRCLGMAFAMFEIKLVLATLLSQCKLRLANSRPVKPVRRGVTLAPPNSLKLCLIERR